MEYSTPKNGTLLDQLYAIDAEAYGNQAVSREVLERWISINPQSIGLLLDEGEIAGAYGLLPISRSQARRFIWGAISETELDPLPASIENHNYWYWSGIVVPPKYRGVHRGVLRELLLIGVGSWLRSKAAGFDQPLDANQSRSQPLHLYATGCTQQGLALINRFKFDLIRDDDAPLYVRDIYNRREALRSIGKMLADRTAAAQAICGSL